MLIRLIPPAPHPTILFGIAFPDVLPGNLPLPPAWSTQLHMLAVDDLDPPPSLHALDKSASLTSLLSEVSFDIPVLTVSCVFVDGAREEWPLMGAGFVDALVSVMNDVNESAAETDRERERERETERQRETSLGIAVPAVIPVKPNKHKKQRSLLMTLVASLVPSGTLSLSSPLSPLRPPSPIQQRLPTPAPSKPLLSPRALRRRARSTLVDIFRQYIVSELAARTPPGGYYVWILQSMARRIADRMAGLVEEAGGKVPDLVHARYPGHADEFGLRLNVMDVIQPSPFYSDDEEGCDGEASDDTTDTDGSSLHTPSSSSVNTSSRPLFSHSLTQPYTHNRPECTLSPSSLAEYTSLSAYSLRLRHLILTASSKHAHEMRETRHAEAILEIRGRRRAWLNKSLLVSNVGDGSGGIRDGGVGMAMPFQKSPLGQSGWTADDVEEVQKEHIWDDGGGEVILGAGRLSGRWFREARLFPVSEEEEYDDDDVELVVSELDMEMEMEGLGWPEEEEEEDRFPFDLERPKIQPRTRMRTMSMHRVESFPRPLTLQRPLTSESLLCQPLKRCRDVDVFDSEGEGGFAQKRGHGGYPDEEFTLAMDLPFKVNEKKVFSKPLRVAGIAYERETEEERVWTPPGLNLGVAVDCR